jgi:hypothetical protein
MNVTINTPFLFQKTAVISLLAYVFQNILA